MTPFRKTATMEWLLPALPRKKTELVQGILRDPSFCCAVLKSKKDHAAEYTNMLLQRIPDTSKKQYILLGEGNPLLPMWEDCFCCEPESPILLARYQHTIDEKQYATTETTHAMAKGSFDVYMECLHSQLMWEVCFSFPSICFHFMQCLTSMETRRTWKD